MAAGIRHWAALLALVVIWGSSYLMIHTALAVWTPYGITGLRLVTGAAVLLVTVFVLRQQFPVTLTHWIWFAALAVVGNCLPFVLVSWGQQFVATGLAGIN